MNDFVFSYYYYYYTIFIKRLSNKTITLSRHVSLFTCGHMREGDICRHVRVYLPVDIWEETYVDTWVYLPVDIWEKETYVDRCLHMSPSLICPQVNRLTCLHMSPSLICPQVNRLSCVYICLLLSYVHR
jgi:hypothetical protein